MWCTLNLQHLHQPIQQAPKPTQTMNKPLPPIKTFLDVGHEQFEFHSHAGPHLGEIWNVHFSTLLTIFALMSTSNLFMVAPSNEIGRAHV